MNKSEVLKRLREGLDPTIQLQGKEGIEISKIPYTVTDEIRELNYFFLKTGDDELEIRTASHFGKSKYISLLAQAEEENTMNHIISGFLTETKLKQIIEKVNEYAKEGVLVNH